MQQFVKQRETIYGQAVIVTPPIDVAEIPLISTELIMYSVTGTSPNLSALLQSSGDLETWTAVGSTDNALGAQGADFQVAKADTTPYGRYIRYVITLAGTTPQCEYSLILNTFPSS